MENKEKILRNLKKDNTGGVLSLKNLVKGIRENDNAEEVKSETNIVNKTDEKSDVAGFAYWVQKIEEYKGSGKKSMIYVDDDIAAVFRLLKANGKIPIFGLVNVILQQWILDNKTEILSKIEAKNRFL